ncbi:hypothetical protein CRUP_017221, partial [Coryphaenoides rupestris]
MCRRAPTSNRRARPSSAAGRPGSSRPTAERTSALAAQQTAHGERVRTARRLWQVKQANLHALVELKPALTHLGDKGQLLLLRFLSIPKGFSYLEERGYVAEELTRFQRPAVYPPVHLYGQLVQDKAGRQLLEAQ